MTNQPRSPRGIPTGGQWATKRHAEAEVDLGSQVNAALDGLADQIQAMKRPEADVVWADEDGEFPSDPVEAERTRTEAGRVAERYDEWIDLAHWGVAMEDSGVSIEWGDHQDMGDDILHDAVDVLRKVSAEPADDAGVGS